MRVGVVADVIGGASWHCAQGGIEFARRLHRGPAQARGGGEKESEVGVGNLEEGRPWGPWGSRYETRYAPTAIAEIANCSAHGECRKLVLPQS